MGQPGIHILNKTGYSMFWNSMWDNKILYTRMLKEDIFLNKFFSLSFNDSASVNTISFKDNNFSLYKKYSQLVDLKKTSLYKYLYKQNKIVYYSTKIWILRFQKWIILYHFLYILNFDKIKLNSKESINYNNNLFYPIKFYKKLNLKINLLCVLKKKSIPI